MEVILWAAYQGASPTDSGLDGEEIDDGMELLCYLVRSTGPGKRQYHPCGLESAGAVPGSLGSCRAHARFSNRGISVGCKSVGSMMGLPLPWHLRVVARILPGVR
jgi:hypothetical protein